MERIELQRQIVTEASAARLTALRDAASGSAAQVGIDTLPLQLFPLPKSLYKFRSLSGGSAARTRDILVNHRLWFSTASTFNDPFDSFPYLSFDGPQESV